MTFGLIFAAAFLAFLLLLLKWGRSRNPILNSLKGLVTGVPLCVCVNCTMPIAFDVIVVATLIAIGMPVGLAMTLLFSLDIFNIYPAMVIGQYISRKLSLFLLVSVGSGASDRD